MYGFSKKFVLFAILSASAALAHAQAPIIWATPALSRTGPADAPGALTPLSLYAARGESESFQVIVRAPASGLTSVDVSVSDLTGPSGVIIPHSQVTLYREYYTTVSSSSLDLGGANRPLPPGAYPDGLIPFTNPATGARLTGATYVAAPFQLPANQNQPIWADIAVPATAAPGYYYGTVTVTSDQGTAIVSLSLKVWNFTLPAQPALKSSFGYHGTRVDDKTSEQVLVANRLMPFQINSWDSSDLMNTLGLNATGLPFFNQINLSTCTTAAPPSVASIQSAAQSYAPGVATYLYAADEITSCVPQINNYLEAWSRNVHAAGSKVLVTTIPDPSLFDDGSGTGQSAVDMWVVLPKQVNSSTSQYITAAQNKGDEVWSYNTLVQDAASPKWEMDFAPVNYRIQPGFLNQQYGFRGLLYYSVDLWSSDPWNNPNVLVDGLFNYPGEGMLVYPGQQVGLPGVVPSIRLKWLRDGVDDFDYIELLKKAGLGTWALQVVSTVASDWNTWTKDPQALESARIQLGEKLDQLSTPVPLLGASAAVAMTPADQSVGVSVTPALSWPSVSGAASYRVFLGTSPSSLVLQATVTTNQYTPGTALAGGTTYYWKVAAVIAGKPQAQTSATISFTTVQTLSAATAVWPLNGGTTDATTLNLQWSAVSGASQYQVYFGASSTSLALYATVNAPGVNAAVYNLNAGATYYWQVVAVAGSSSAKSAVWSFTTPGSSQTVAAPSLVWPANGATGVPSSLSLQWSAVSGATQYLVYVGPNATSLSLWATVAAPVVTMPASNLPTDTYYWQVVAVAGSSSASSAIWSFQTQ